MDTDRLTYRIIQTNRTERRCSRYNDTTGSVSDAVIIREPGHVIAEHNDPWTVRRHLDKIARRHPDVQVRVEPELPPEMPDLTATCAACNKEYCTSSCLVAMGERA